MGNKTDFSEFEKYLKNFEEMADDFDEFLKTFLLQMAYRVIAKTKPRTPVDTGFLREAWYVGNDTHAIREGSDGQMTSDYASAFASKADISSVTVQGGILVVEIGNIAEYASFIEYGHAYENGNWYTGKYMMTISIDEIQAQMPARFSKQFQKFLKDRGVG